MADEIEAKVTTWKQTLIDKIDLRTAVALMVVQAFIIILVLSMFVKLPVDQATLAIISAMFGSLMTKFGTIVDYLFGSSDGSKDKDNTIKQAALSALPPNDGK